MRNKKRVAAIMATVLFCAVAMISCTHTSTEATPAVSFSKEIVPIFAVSCAVNSSCHQGASSANDEVDLDSATAYNSLFSRKLVSVSAPTSSLLYVEISNDIMPKAPYAPLSAAQISLVLNWIKQGALNN